MMQIRMRLDEVRNWERKDSNSKESTISSWETSARVCSFTFFTTFIGTPPRKDS